MKPLLVIAITILSFTTSFGQATLTHCQTYLKLNNTNPTDYVLSKFKTYDLVILGEDHAIKQNLDFVASLIPELYRKGVYNLGMEFGASEMQHKMDSLTTAPEFNADVAKAMMYYYNVGWAYKEYILMSEAAWKFNKSLPAGSPKFRIINLSYQFDWSGLKKGQQRTAENMSKVFWKGTADKYRASVVDTEIMQHHQKALLLVGTPHAYTKYSFCNFDYLKDNFCTCDSDWLGQRLLRNYPNKVFSIILHQPFYNMPNKTPFMISPCNGKVEQIMAANNNKPVGFNLVNSPMGQLADSSRNSLGYKNFTLGQLFDGYIFLAPFSQLQGCTTDTTFFKNKSWESIKAQLPDPDWRGDINNLADYLKVISDYTDIKKRYKAVLE
jgi:hypothetical protein